ncbi:flavin-containing monooxygenase [Algoriphagus marinus]|uniref:flavin-containing monooxygenase n=1 Tax=Algoriphagus marinus TaxID=1925762 RepID=UPI000B771DE9|nr:NAD(P)/FAD-dependent oxidoreductase [Algoriphagus marinus]
MMHHSSTTQATYDIIIVGAGISGIGMAYWLQKKCPEKRVLILEARDSIGGTWSLFQYPGIRSDSDMFTFGFRFKPWNDPQSLSSGDKILKYLEQTVKENKLDQLISFKHKMLSSNWSDEEKCWSLQVDSPEGLKVLKSRFLSICTGYYNYQEAHRPKFKGEELYQGKIILPQFWPKNLDFSNQKIAVIGSGATAITLVPSLANQGAKQVTMIQRSPTYVMNLPNRNGQFAFLKKVLPNSWAYRLTRSTNILLSMASFGFSKAFPKFMKKIIMNAAAKQLPDGYPVEKHFNPSYNPWDQRLCVVPDGNFFTSINKGDAHVVTGEISHFSENGVQMKNGEFIEADLIVLATGLKIQLLGGAQLSVNNIQVKVSESYIYKGMMVSNLPNLIYCFGYTNASWTLKVDLTANYLCKILKYMDKNGFEVVTPKSGKIESEENFLNLSSGYITRAENELPKQGSKRPWRVYQNYLVDMLTTRFGPIRDQALKFTPKS